MQLFYSPGTVALATMIALEEAGADYQSTRVDFGSNAQQSPEYLGINPKGRVPSLETEHGILTETPAILVYIAQMFPLAKLVPDDPFEFAKLQEFNCYLASTVHVAHAHRGRGTRWTDDPAALQALKLKVPQNMRRSRALVESQLGHRKWVMGDRYSVADPYLFTIAGFLASDGVDIAEFPGVAGHSKRMRQRPAVIRALATV